MRLATALMHAVESRRGITHIQVDGTRIEQSYSELAAEAERIASGLLALGVRRGAAVVLQLDASRDFAPAFWACMLGGFVAVPFIVPATLDDEFGARRLAAACTLLGDCYVLTSDRLATLRSTSPRALEPTADDATALIVFTSSTTGVPKAVTHHHRAVLANCRGKAIANELDASSVILNWSPLHHIAPLVRMHILPVVLGCHQIQASTQWVLGDPLRWLDVASAERVTFTWAPNFALGLINDRADEIARRRWDLSSVKRLIVSAEPVVASSVFRFERLLAPHGLASGTVRASWGMTETASGITYSQPITRLGENDLVDVGCAIPGARLRIVDDAGVAVSDGVVGRLQVAGESITTGYFGDPALTRSSFTPDGWLDTGDLGSLRDGALTITGRTKDIIIVNGHNVTPHEIEVALAGIDGITEGGVVAAGFRAEGANTESVAIFAHLVSNDTARVARDVRARIARTLGLLSAKIVAVGPGDLRTGGVGKLARAQLVRRLEAGELIAITDEPSTPNAAPADDITNTLLAMCRELGLSPTSADDDLFDLGAHSLILAQLLARIQRELDVQLSIGTLFEHSTIVAIAAQIEAARPARPGPPPTALAPSGLVRARMLPPQRGTYLIDRLERTNWLNRIKRSEILDGALDVTALERALEAMRERHSILRTRFFEENDELWQEVLPRIERRILRYEDLSSLSGAEQERAEDALHEQLMGPFELANGEVVRALLIKRSPTRHRLTLVLHRIVCDPYSIAVFEDELFTLWRGATPPPAPIQYLDLVAHLDRVERSEVGARQRAFWRDRLAGAVPLLLPNDLPMEPVDALRAKHSWFVAFPVASLSGVLDRAATDAVQRIARETNVSVMSLLLSRMAAHLTETTGQRDLSIVSHLTYQHIPGLENTLGLFANPLVMRLSTEGAPTFSELAARTHKTVSDAFDHGTADVLSVAPNLFRMFFNYIYVADSVSRHPQPPSGVTREPVAIPGTHTDRTPYDLILFIAHRHEQIHFELTYNLQLFREETASRFLRGYLAGLEQLA